MQLAVTRDILFPVVLGSDFLQTHGGVMSFPTKQLYLTNPSPKPTESPLNNSHTQNPYTPSMHPPNTYHPHPRTSTKPNQPYHIISNEPVTIPPRANTMNHPLCPSAFQKLLIRTVWTAFVGQPVHYTPVIINAENDNLPVHFINDRDQEIVIPKHSYVENMEPVNEHLLSACLF